MRIFLRVLGWLCCGLAVLMVGLGFADPPRLGAAALSTVFWGAAGLALLHIGGRVSRSF